MLILILTPISNLFAFGILGAAEWKFLILSAIIVLFSDEIIKLIRRIINK
jgi:hypothetical protein